MSHLTISHTVTKSEKGEKTVHIMLANNMKELQGTATLTIKEGHNIEQKFENLIKLLISNPTK